jgi:ABC-type Fe3+-siderophore transport system, permease component
MHGNQPLSRRIALAPALSVGAAVLALAVAMSIGTGGVAIPPGHILAHLGDTVFGWGAPLPARDYAILVGIRLPRIILAMLVGAALSVAGAALQGVFRNPLADPGLIGVSSGAALAAASVIVLAGAHAATAVMLPLAAFCGGLAATALVFVLARRDGTLSVGGMLLAGIAVNALAGAGIGLFSYLGDDLQLRQLTFWTLGSLGGATWAQLLPASAGMILAMAGLLAHARTMDIFVLGERDAHALGVAPGPFTIRIIMLAALAVGAAVSVSGLIGFVGLVVPHMVRMMLGPSHRRMMPVSMVLGSLVMIVADTLARTIAMPAEVPIGLLLGLIGAPFFLWLLRHTRAMGA